MKGRIVESDGEDDRKRIRKTLGLLCAFLGILVVAAYQPSPSVVGGKDDEHISVEVFEALVSSGGRKEIDIRSYFNTGTASGLKAGEKWILFFASDANLEEETLHPYYMEKVN